MLYSTLQFLFTSWSLLRSGPVLTRETRLIAKKIRTTNLTWSCLLFPWLQKNRSMQMLNHKIKKQNISADWCFSILGQILKPKCYDIWMPKSIHITWLPHKLGLLVNAHSNVTTNMAKRIVEYNITATTFEPALPQGNIWHSSLPKPHQNRPS